MPGEQFEWQRRIKEVEREHSAIRLATDRLLGEAQRDPTVLEGSLRTRDIVHASERLDGTYIIRLFAEFETGLRLFWATRRNTEPPVRDLVNGVAALCVIPDDDRDSAHAVREYRNTLVHEREDQTEPISLADARSHLCRFFSFLPMNW
jgi:hypothetical protein